MQNNEHDILCQRAAALVGDIIGAPNHTWGGLDADCKERLRLGAIALEHAIQINKKNGDAMWLLGKIHQRAGDLEKASFWFYSACLADRGNSNFWREAGIVFAMLNLNQKAIYCFEFAVKLNPSDGGLYSNLALAFLFMEDISSALIAARTAVLKNPSDILSQQVKNLCEDVVCGKRACPNSFGEI